MAKNYHPADFEKKWQDKWARKPLYKAKDFAKKKKFYALVEYPYPSGEGLHIGHAFTNTIMDVFARQKRMAGFNAMQPMGWDAFGLPAENSAIKQKIHPAKLTARNTTRFKKQDERLAFSYDWSREINTTNPDYYKWTQWIFLQMFKEGLAYKQSTPVGWCPSCRIILANEEIVSGNCERCGHEAEYREQEQWLLRITKYADRLADELEEVDYPDYIKASQRNWIGRSYGVNIDYPVVGKDFKISCYSTRPDTNFGATFVVIAPEHSLVSKLTTKENQDKVSNYIKASKKKSEMERTELLKEKTGVLTGSYALNQLTNKKMPIYVSDFVVLTSGTGMVVGVPAHDERDFDFARKYKLEIIPVIKPKQGKWDFEKGPFLEIDEAIVFNSDFLNGLPALKAKEKIIDYLVKKGWGERKKNYHLRDWIFSRQHYWGEPFPMIFCQTCADKKISWWETPEGKKTKPLFKPIKVPGWFPMAARNLPLKLPEVKNYEPTDTGESPLAKITDWVKTKCPYCGGEAKRETDTMPNWAGSSWYFLRYCDPDNESMLADKKKLDYWLPVDVYLGGAEHTTLHLLYSRFWHKFLNDIQAVPGKEPYAVRRQHGDILAEDGQRMSKSKGNVVNPNLAADKFGVDALRVYLLFMGPYESTMPWSPKGIEGSYRFLARIFKIFNTQGKIGAKTASRLSKKLHQTIKKVSEDIKLLKHNTAIAALMEFLSAWRQEGSLSQDDAGVFLRLLAPFAPYLSEELWVEVLKKPFSVHQQSWPKFDRKLVLEEKVVVVVQVNGKMRGQIETPPVQAKKQAEVEKLAKVEANVSRHLEDQKIKKVIFVPGKLINFVV